jgi:hypothetical protein
MRRRTKNKQAHFQSRQGKLIAMIRLTGRPSGADTLHGPFAALRRM